MYQLGNIYAHKHTQISGWNNCKWNSSNSSWTDEHLDFCSHFNRSSFLNNVCPDGRDFATGYKGKMKRKPMWNSKKHNRIETVSLPFTYEEKCSPHNKDTLATTWCCNNMEWYSISGGRTLCSLHRWNALGLLCYQLKLILFWNLTSKLCSEDTPVFRD